MGAVQKLRLPEELPPALQALVDADALALQLSSMAAELRAAEMSAAAAAAVRTQQEHEPAGRGADVLREAERQHKASQWKMEEELRGVKVALETAEWQMDRLMGERVTAMTELAKVFNMMNFVLKRMNSVLKTMISAKERTVLGVSQVGSGCFFLIFD